MEHLSEIAPGVLLATSRNDVTTSVVLVGPRDSAVLIDPAWEPDELDGIARDLARRGLRVLAGLATHFHHDHLLWHPAFGSMPRWASPATVDIVSKHRDDLLKQLGPTWPSELGDLFGRVTAIGSGRLPWDGPPVELIVHDAHAIGHMAAWLPDQRVLIAGDMLSDVELPLPDPDDVGLVRYRAGLAAIAPYASRAALLIPGHGTPTHSPIQRLDADRDYVRAVLSDAPCVDERITRPEMAEAHVATVALARRG